MHEISKNFTSPSFLIRQKKGLLTTSSSQNSMEEATENACEKQARVVRETSLLHSDDSDPMFDRFTSLAKRLFNVPIALITVLDQDKFWIKSNVGLPGLTDLPSEESFCKYTVMDQSPDVFCVEDVRKDERFKNNPMVLGPPYARFYAGNR